MTVSNPGKINPDDPVGSQDKYGYYNADASSGFYHHGPTWLGGNLFPQTNGTQWIGSSSSQFNFSAASLVFSGGQTVDTITTIVSSTSLDTQLPTAGAVYDSTGAVAGDLASHVADTANPHAVTAAQAGADPTGTASSAVTTHESTYTHSDIASNTADRHTIATVTGNGISLVGQEISLDIGTGATDVAAGNHLHTGVYDPAGSASAVAGDLTTHEGLTNGAHGISRIWGNAGR